MIRVNERDGPFDGILRFSQGGAFASIISGLAATRLQSLSYLIILSAFPERATDITTESWYNENDLLSLHVWGTNAYHYRHKLEKFFVIDSFHLLLIRTTRFM